MKEGRGRRGEREGGREGEGYGGGGKGNEEQRGHATPQPVFRLILLVYMCGVCTCTCLYMFTCVKYVYMYLECLFDSLYKQPDSRGTGTFIELQVVCCVQYLTQSLQCTRVHVHDKQTSRHFPIHKATQHYSTTPEEDFLISCLRWDSIP